MKKVCELSYRALELAHGEIYRSDVTDLASFLQFVTDLLDQLHALFVRSESVGQITDSRVNVTETRESRSRCLSVLALHREYELISMSRERLFEASLAEVGRAEIAVGTTFALGVVQRACYFYKGRNSGMSGLELATQQS